MGFAITAYSRFDPKELFRPFRGVVLTPRVVSFDPNVGVKMILFNGDFELFLRDDMQWRSRWTLDLARVNKASYIGLFVGVFEL